MPTDLFIQCFVNPLLSAYNTYFNYYIIFFNLKQLSVDVKLHIFFDECIICHQHLLALNWITLDNSYNLWYNHIGLKKFWIRHGVHILSSLMVVCQNNMHEASSKKIICMKERPICIAKIITQYLEI